MAHILKRIKLPSGIPAQVEVWQLGIDLQLPVKDCDLALLSDAERLNVLRYYGHADRIRFIATRVTLRKLLADKLLVRPETLDIVTNDYGKPNLKDYADIAFNVSHSGSYALIALSTVNEVGVDIERYDRRIDVRNLSEIVLTSLERKYPFETTEAFIQKWVAKESVLKALGVGIANHLQAISILLGDNEEYNIVHDNPAWEDLKVWWIEAPDGYASALAIKSKRLACDMGKED